MCSCSKENSLFQENDSAEAAGKADAWVNDDDSLNLCIYNIDTLNPLKTSVKHNAEVLSLMYDSLFTLSSDFSAIPCLAESYSVSKSGLTYTVIIKKNVFFSNGKPLTSHDVAYSLNTIISSDGYYKNRLNMVKGVNSSGQKIEIYLKKPTANFNTLLDFPILPNDNTPNENTKKNIPNSIISGSGLFILSEYKINKKIILKPNESHHSGTVPYIKTIIIHIAPDRETAVSMLENSRIDMLTGYAANIDKYTPRKTLDYYVYNGCGFIFLGINIKNDVKGTPNILNAIFSAINRSDAISSTNANAIESVFPINPKSYIHTLNKTYFPLPDKTLEDDGWKDSDNDSVLDKTIARKKYSLSFELLTCSDNPTKTLIAEIIRKNLAAYGIRIKIRSLSFDIYKSKLLSGDYELFLGETTLLPNFDFDDILSLTVQNTNDSTLHDIIKKTKTTLDNITQKRNYENILNLYIYHPSAIGIMFKNEFLICDRRINAENISTLNPYKSAHSWSFRN